MYAFVRTLVLIWYADLHLQLRPLQRGAFTGEVREADALDWNC